MPRYIIYLAKYMQGIVDISHDLYNRENIKDLRADVCDQIDKANTLISGNRLADNEEKKSIRDDMESTDKSLNDFRNTYDNFTLEATKLNEAECNIKFDSCMNVVIQSRGKDEGAVATEEERTKKRMFSFM